MKNKKPVEIGLSPTIIIIAEAEEMGEQITEVWLDGYLAGYE